MIEVFCTYLDKNYLPQGITMINSLLKVKSNIKIYVICFDDYSLTKIGELGSNVVSLNINLIETKLLKNIKLQRSKVEYYWTLTPVIIKYILLNYCNKRVTYLDADLFFLKYPYKFHLEIQML